MFFQPWKCRTFLSLYSLKTNPRRHFFNQFNVNGALRARTNPLFVCLFSTKVSGAFRARQKLLFFFKPFSTKVRGALRARKNPPFFDLSPPPPNPPSGPSNSDSPRNFLYFGGLRALYDPLSVYNEALLVLNRTLKRWTTTVCKWYYRVTKR